MDRVPGATVARGSTRCWPGRGFAWAGSGRAVGGGPAVGGRPYLYTGRQRVALTGDGHGCALEKDRELVIGPEQDSGADATSPEAGAENQGAEAWHDIPFRSRL